MDSYQVKLSSVQKTQLTHILAASRFTSVQSYIDYHIEKDTKTLKQKPNKELIFKL